MRLVMKKWFLLALSVAFAMGVSAQKKNELTLEQAQYRITYQVKAVTGSTEKDSTGYIYEDDVCRLDIGPTVSHFYSYMTQQKDSAFAEILRRGSFDLSSTGRYGALRFELYRGYPSGRSLYLLRRGGDKYRIEEPLETPEWQIVADSVRNLLGYSCNKAVCHFKGRTWTAWYAEDIPLDNGPWKLCGLPGLILSASDSTQQYLFEAVGLQQLGSSMPITYDKTADKCEKTTAAQFIAMRSRSTGNDLLREMNIKVSKVEDKDGNDITSTLNNVKPYNPIELIKK